MEFLEHKLADHLHLLSHTHTHIYTYECILTQGHRHTQDKRERERGEHKEMHLWKHVLNCMDGEKEKRIFTQEIVCRNVRSCMDGEKNERERHFFGEIMIRSTCVKRWDTFNVHTEGTGARCSCRCGISLWCRISGTPGPSLGCWGCRVAAC